MTLRRIVSAPLCMVALVLLGLVAAPLRAQAPRPATFLAEHYDVSAALDAIGQSISATAKINFKALEASSSVRVELHPNLIVKEVKGADGKPLTFERDTQNPLMVIVQLPTPVATDGHLTLTYTYFQLPLMILIIAPALDGMKREWREASATLGATGWQYWRYIALPILLPSLLGTVILLFGNAFGAQATAYALTGGTGNLVTILISAQISGDALHNPGLGNALALGMVFVMIICIATYSLLQAKTARWLRA